MSTIKSFCGKFYIIDYQNSYIILDSNTNKLTISENTQNIDPYCKFNLYGDPNGPCYIQAMNGKYVSYDAMNGFTATKEEQEEADVFQCSDCNHIYVTLANGDSFYWNVEDNMITPYSGSDIPDTAFFTKKQITKGFDQIQSTGAIACDLTWSDLSKSSLTFCSFGGANLSYADLSECDLKYANFSSSKTVAQYTNFTGSKLNQALFMQADFTGADFTKTDLMGASAQNTTFVETIFDRANLTAFSAMKSNCTNSSFIGANCTQASFQQVNFQGVNLSTADFTNAMFDRNCFNDANFTGTKAPNINFTSCTVNENTVFQHTDLRKCNFTGMNLQKTSMRYANLSDGVFDGADMSYGDFSYADFTNASLKNTVKLIGASLANATLLEADLTGAQLGVTQNNSSYVNEINGTKETDESVGPECLQAVLDNAADLTGAYMPNAKLKQANLYGVNMTGVNWYGAKASAEDADLELVNFTSANLSTMNFKKARMYGCNFDYANLISTNFRGAHLAPGLGGKRVSFSYANLQGADFFDSDIVDAVFTNAAVALNDGPYFTLIGNDITNYMKELNQNGPVPTDIQDQFNKNGYPLSANATVEVLSMNAYWYINNPSDVQYPKYTIYLAGDVIRVGGYTIGVHLFSIHEVSIEIIDSLNNQEIPDDLRKDFANAGYPLIDNASITNCSIENKKWYLDNATHDQNKIQKGYLEFVLKVDKKSEENTYLLYVYGTTIATVKITENNTLQQENTSIATTKLIQNLLKGDTICPSGQKISVLTDKRKNVRMTWEDVMTASTLPKEPICIPDPFHWC